MHATFSRKQKYYFKETIESYGTASELNLKGRNKQSIMIREFKYPLLNSILLKTEHGFKSLALKLY